MAKVSTFQRITIHRDGEEPAEVILGTCHRLRAAERFKRNFEEYEGQPELAGEAEQWMAFAAFEAAKKPLGLGPKATFDQWLKTYIGFESEDGEDPGPTPV